MKLCLSFGNNNTDNNNTDNDNKNNVNYGHRFYVILW